MPAKKPGRLFKIHRRIGWILALPLLCIAGSGIVLAFYDELRYGAFPYRLDAPVVETMAPERLAQSVRYAFPKHRLSKLYLPGAPEQTARAHLIGAKKIVAFFHPGSGNLIAVRAATQKDWLDLIYELHRGKLFDLSGQILASMSGLGVTVLWLAGLAMRRRRSVRRNLGAGRSNRNTLRRLHRWAGVFPAALVALLTMAGAMLNVAGPLKQWLDPSPRTINIQFQVGSALPLSEIVTAADSAYPDASLERIYFPDSNGIFRLRFRDGGWVHIDARNGQITQLRKPFSDWIGVLYSLHSGRLFGIAGPWIIAAIGFLLLLSVVSGLVLSLFKRRSTKPNS